MVNEILYQPEEETQRRALDLYILSATFENDFKPFKSSGSIAASFSFFRMSVSLKIKSDFVIMCTGYLNLRNIFKISRVNSNSFSISIYGSDAEPKFKNALS